MPEIPLVNPGETIEAAWGNQVAARTIQRYLNEADRDFLLPAPVAGDLAYLDDETTISYFDGAAWVYIPFQTFPKSGRFEAVLIGPDQPDPPNNISLFGSSGDIEANGTVRSFGGGFFSDIDGDFNTPVIACGVPGVTPRVGFYRTGGGGLGISQNNLTRGIFDDNFFRVGNNVDTGLPIMRHNGFGAAAPAYAFQNSATMGMYRHSSTTVGFSGSAGGGGQMRLSDTAFVAEPAYSATTGSAANVRVESSGQLFRSTSSLAYKSHIKAISLKRAKDRIAALKPIEFKSKLGVAADPTPLDDEDGNPIEVEAGLSNRRFWGFGAEEVEAAFSEAAEDENYDVRAIVAALVRIVQEMIK